MLVNSLIDLFVPTVDAHSASVSVAMAGLDSGVLAFSDLGELEAYEPSGPTPMHAGLHIEVEQTALLVLLPSCDRASYAPLLELDTVKAVLSSVRALEGCAIIVGGSTSEDPLSALPAVAQTEKTGRLVHRVWGSLLARDLSFEETTLTGLRLLGGTGPEGTLKAVGQYATLLPIQADDRSGLITALIGGLGIGVERVMSEDNAAAEQPRKRRRRRRRKRGRKSEAGDDASQGSNDS